MESPKKCNCMHCRNKEFGESYYMYMYTHITDTARTIKLLAKYGVPMGHIHDNGLSGELACLEYNFEADLEDVKSTGIGSISIEFEDALKKWGLYDEFNTTVSETTDILKKLDRNLIAKMRAGVDIKSHSKLMR